MFPADDADNPYNEFVQEHYRHPRNLGKLPNATHHARLLWEDTMLEFHLRVVEDIIEQAKFRAIGCAGTVAAGSAMTDWLTGRPFEEARSLTPPQVLEVLGGLPPERHYCADSLCSIPPTVRKLFFTSMLRDP